MNVESILKNAGFIPPESIAKNRFNRGEIEISTVRLPKFSQEEENRYETCIFKKNGDSEVVGVYGTRKEAIACHTFLVNSLKFLAKK